MSLPPESPTCADVTGLRPPKAAGRWRIARGLILVLALSACAPTPQAPVSGRAPAAALESFPVRPATVQPLVSGPEALRVWLREIAGARTRVDLMTYIMRADRSGRAVAQALLSAADRGVKVRVLVDDAFMAMKDDRMGGLASHPNVELRAFNPFSRFVPALVGYVLDNARVNRRMHNKVLIVDAGTAILGGRNIGDEYFGQDPDRGFADLELLVHGPVVADMAVGFGTYWNDPRAAPYQRLRPDRVRESGKALLNDTPETLALMAGKPPERAQRSHAARVRYVMDDPAKLQPRGHALRGATNVGRALFGAIRAARREVLIVTPYFVPQDLGADLLRSLVDRGVKVTVVTNSLAATNHPIAHGSYAQYRNRLAALGVNFLETRVDGGSWLDPGLDPAPGRMVLHTKLVVIDRRTVLVGSPNFDPRSLRLNTESLLEVVSPPLAGRLADDWARITDHAAYAVTIGASGLPHWRGRRAQDDPTFLPNPGAGIISRLIALLGGMLPIEDDL